MVVATKRSHLGAAVDVRGFGAGGCVAGCSVVLGSIRIPLNPNM